MWLQHETEEVYSLFYRYSELSLHAQTMEAVLGQGANYLLRVAEARQCIHCKCTNISTREYR